MEWIQLVLPREELQGLQQQLLRYLQTFQENGLTCSHLSRTEIEEDFFGWLQQRQDAELGLSGCQQWLYLSVTPHDEVVGSALITMGEQGTDCSLQVSPALSPEQKASLGAEIKQQLEDFGFSF